jgi:hypothetical protein
LIHLLQQTPRVATEGKALHDPSNAGRAGLKILAGPVCIQELDIG